MSLILDALRKSEAQRRRGEMPDLRAELPPVTHRVTPRRRWPLWFAGIAVAVALVALGWGIWNRTPDAPPADTAAAVPDDVPASATTEVPAAPDAVSSSPSLPPPAPPVRSKPLPGAEPEPVQPVEGDVYAAASAREPPPAATPPAPTQPASPDADASAPNPADPRFEEAIANAKPPTATAPTVTAAPPVRSPAAAPAPVAPLPLPPPATGAPVRLSDLSPGEREQLPALKISMHMFGPTPDQRFAIIDGARVGQGDRVGDAVVEQIAADGVVLNWHGRRVALPLR